MPDVLKAGEVADPFGTRAVGKDQSRVATGNPITPVLASSVGDEALRRKRTAENLMAQTRLKDMDP